MSKQTKDKNKNKQEEIPIVNGIGQGMGLLGGMLSSNVQNPESELPPLPSTNGANLATVPATAAVSSPITVPVASNINPNMGYSQSSSFNWSKPVLMNAEEIAKAEAQKAEEERKANEYNATLASRINTLNSTVKKQERQYDDWGNVIPSTYTPMAPLPVMPKEVEIPRMAIANESYGESRREGSGGGSGQPKPKPGEVYGMGVNGNNLEATFYTPGTYKRSSSRSHIMANADNALVAAKSVIENMFGTNSELSDVKPSKDISFNYYVLQNGRMIPTATPQNMGLPNETIPKAIMKLAKNLYIKDYGTDGLDVKTARNGTGASGLLFNINALKSNSGGEYENKIYKSIGKALDMLNLTSKSFSNGDKNNALVDSFRNNPQFSQTVASGDRAAKDKFAKDSRSILEEVIYTMLLAQALGKDV